MATVLGPDMPEVRYAADEAREILARLGARPFLAHSRRSWRLRRRTNIRSQPAEARPARVAGGLTRYPTPFVNAYLDIRASGSP